MVHLTYYITKTKKSYIDCVNLRKDQIQQIKMVTSPEQSRLIINRYGIILMVDISPRDMTLSTSIMRQIDLFTKSYMYDFVGFDIGIIFYDTVFSIELDESDHLNNLYQKYIKMIWTSDKIECKGINCRHYKIKNALIPNKDRKLREL